MKKIFRIIIYFCILITITFSILPMLIKSKDSYAINVSKQENTNSILLAENEESLTLEQQAVVDVAYAFYYRSLAMQYDGSSFTYQGGTSYKSRFDRHTSPEAATPQDTKYHVCSVFTYNVYYEAFSNNLGQQYQIKDKYNTLASAVKTQIRLANKDSKYYNEKIAVDYIKGSNGEIHANKEIYKERILEKIQPGDIISYQRTNGNHSILYLGNNEILHSTGSSYNYKTKKENYDQLENNGFIEGTIRKRKLSDDILDSVLGEKVIEIAIIRPLNEISSNPIEDSEFGISEKTRERMKNNKLVRTKISSVEKHDSVNLNDEITYTIIIENMDDNKSYDEILVTDVVPDKTELVSISTNGENNNGKLKWIINIPPKSKKELSYTVRVINQPENLGKTIINNSTVIDGVPLNKIETTINNTLNKTEKFLINYKLLKVIENNNNYEDLSAFMEYIYPNLEFPNLDDIISNLFEFEEIKIYHDSNSNLKVIEDGIVKSGSSTFGGTDIGTEEEPFIHTAYRLGKNKNNEIFDMYVNGMFGGLYVTTEQEPTRNDERNSTITFNDLITGDILIVLDSHYPNDDYLVGAKSAYLYIGDNRFATTIDKKITIIGEDDSNRIIDSLLGQDCFIVLRPSYVIPERKGNIINNDKVNIEDVKELATHIVNNDFKNTLVEDINDDGLIKMNDVMLLVKSLAYNVK